MLAKIHAAGGAGALFKADASDELIEQVFNLNARSIIACCRGVIPLMRAQGGGIIHVTSQAARTGGSSGSVMP